MPQHITPPGYLPHIAYDSVLFGFSGDELKILILEYHNTGWFALPGGFVGPREDLDEAAKRGLRERTGLSNIHLEQFHTFGSLQRFVPEVMQTILEANQEDPANYPWMLDRFISVGYYSLLDYRKVAPRPDALSDSLEWYPVNALPTLILDHQIMVKKALETLRRNLDTVLLGVNLLPERFTIKELQRVHEAVLGEQLRRSSFQRRMLNSGLLRRHEKLFTGGAHKAPFLYSFINGQDEEV